MPAGAVGAGAHTAQAKNGDNTEGGGIRRAGEEERRARGRGESGGGHTTLDISYPSARNPLTS